MNKEASKFAVTISLKETIESNKYYGCLEKLSQSVIDLCDLGMVDKLYASYLYEIVTKKMKTTNSFMNPIARKEEFVKAHKALILLEGVNPKKEQEPKETKAGYLYLKKYQNENKNEPKV